MDKNTHTSVARQPSPGATVIALKPKTKSAVQRSKAPRTAQPQAKAASVLPFASATDSVTPFSVYGTPFPDLVKELLAESRQFMGQAMSFESRGKQALASGLAATLDLARPLVKNISQLWQLCEQERVLITPATRKSPCLAVIRLVTSPKFDLKTGSLYGRVLTYALGTGLNRKQLHDAILQEGIVEIAKKQTARRRAPGTRPNKSPPAGAAGNDATGKKPVRSQQATSAA